MINDTITDIMLGIDPGITNYGFVIKQTTATKEDIYQVIKTDKKSSFILNSHSVIKNLYTLCKKNNHRFIVIFERVIFYKYNNNYQKLILVEYEIRKLLFNLDIRYWTYTSGQIKNWYLDKKDTVAHNKHELDAIKLIELATNELNIITKLKKEQEINKRYLIEKWNDAIIK